MLTVLQALTTALHYWKRRHGKLKVFVCFVLFDSFIRQSNMNFYLDKGTSMFEQLFTQGKTSFNKIAVTCFQYQAEGGKIPLKPVFLIVLVF